VGSGIDLGIAGDELIARNVADNYLREVDCEQKEEA
jgi:hypothetical protein